MHKKIANKYLENVVNSWPLRGIVLQEFANKIFSKRTNPRGNVILVPFDS